MTDRTETFSIFAIAMVAIFSLAGYLGFLAYAAGTAAAAPDGKTYEGFVSGTLQSGATALAGMLAIGAGFLAYRGARRQGELSLEAAMQTAQVMRETSDQQIKAEAERIATLAEARKRRFAQCLSMDVVTMFAMLKDLENTTRLLEKTPAQGTSMVLAWMRFHIPETITAKWDDLAQLDDVVVGQTRAMAGGLTITLEMFERLRGYNTANPKIEIRDIAHHIVSNLELHQKQALRIVELLEERHGIQPPDPKDFIRRS